MIKVIAYEELLSGKVKVSPSSNVAIVGAGGIGFDVASFLLHTPAPQDNNVGEKAIERFMQVCVLLYMCACLLDACVLPLFLLLNNYHYKI
jgi:hypothetical protein